MELLIIRHGRSQGDDENRVEGGGWDAPLTEVGIEQANRLARRLKEEGYEFDLLLSSPMLRTSKVAELIAAELGYEIAFDDRLREMHTGVIAAKTIKEAHEIHPMPEGGFRSYIRIPEGECYIDQISRVLHFYTELIDKHMDKRVCIVTHGGTVNILLSIIFGLPLTSPLLEKPMFRFRTGDTSMHKFTIMPERVVTHFLNDTAHLRS